MAASEKNGNGGVCMCGCGMHGRHWTFFLLRVLITILILMVVFWFGLAVGRMSSGYARSLYMMRNGYDSGGIYGGTGGMMPVYGATSSPTTGGVQNY